MKTEQRVRSKKEGWVSLSKANLGNSAQLVFLFEDSLLPENQCELHNQTMTITTFSEKIGPAQK